jgi:DNA polymerase III subunit gamma/tau
MSETPTAAAYRVLARKYRPSSFDALIGQDAMVRTLGNAIAQGRIAHAFLLTGVRGVGKTSTARLIAKALNCVGPDGQGGPTISPCGVCEHCVAISESRHIDVIEMDAASRTGVDDVREIIEAVRYASVSARTKIYIIDEVHMLSKNAFNALLKTLEEPPPHVKFIFATTEIRKVPITVLSRCQRFDLKRIPTATLAAHFKSIVSQEAASIDDEAVHLIARAAEGSVRDGLSILDQAIAHGHGTVTSEAVRDMLGLADRARVLDLMDDILSARPAAALANLREQYDRGADPGTIIEDLLAITHTLTRAQATNAPDGDASEEERSAINRWLDGLSVAAVHRLWQLLLKGLHEVQQAPDSVAAAEMLLLRVMHAAQLPDPGDLVKRLLDGGAAPAKSVPSPAPAPSAPGSYAELVQLFEDNHEGLLGKALRDDAVPLRYAPGLLELALRPRAPRDLAGKLKTHLEAWTGLRWAISVSNAPAEAPTMREQEQAAEQAFRASVEADPLVQAVLSTFPGAKLTHIERSAPALPPALEMPS